MHVYPCVVLYRYNIILLLMATDYVCVYIILYVIIIMQRAKQLFIASSFSVVGMTHYTHANSK